MLDNDLSMFTGSENYIRHQFGALLFTDGINFLRNKEENGVVDCFWLVDAIASHQSDRLDQACDGFQVWFLLKTPTPTKPHCVTLVCRRDTNTKDLVRQVIEYSDFPFDQVRTDEFKLYVGGAGRPPAKGISGRILMLPSEY